MKLIEIVNQCYLPSSFAREEANKKREATFNLPDEVSNFIIKFHQNKMLSKEEFESFARHLNNCTKNTQNMIIHLLYSIGFKIYRDQEVNIKAAIDLIDSHLEEKREIPKSTSNIQEYIGLLNSYLLFSNYLPIESVVHTNRYPGITIGLKKIICFDIPFALNALRLTGELPHETDFQGFNVSKPCYPLNLKVTSEEKIFLKRGIKDSETYYPYKMVNKIAAGDTGNNTFIATDGRKKLFIRGVERYSPNAILASKIATLISSTHFSSERLLNNHLVASRSIASYARSVAESETLDEIESYIQKNYVFPGSGILDEVTNFVHETDPNIENLGLSSENINESQLSKIDFDRCDLFSKLSKVNYEQDMLTKQAIGLYHQASYVVKDPVYITEKLTTRLKLAMITEPLLNELAKKAFISEKKKQEAIQECNHRSTIALELFFEHRDSRSFLIKNPMVLKQCYYEIVQYISNHFEQDIQNILLCSLNERAFLIKKEIEKFDISLPFPFDERQSFKLEENNNNSGSPFPAGSRPPKGG